MQHNKTIVMGDIHGEEKWKDIIEKHPDAQYIFLGDYCDPYKREFTTNHIIENLKNIIELKKSNPENIVLLFGNHDLHYIYPQAPMCSRLMIDATQILSNLFTENIELFCNAYRKNKLLFTHAGVSEEWLHYTNMGRVENLEQCLNSPNEYPEIFICGKHRGGSKPYSGIFWADSKEMYNPLEGYIQIVGHSRMQQINIQKSQDNNTAVIFCDSLWNNNYVIIEEGEKETTIYAASLIEDSPKEILQFYN